MADVRVADQVFAPHYAAPLQRAIVTETTLRANRGGEGFGVLRRGEMFEVLELTATQAWGVAADGLVGYVDRDALALD